MNEEAIQRELYLNRYYLTLLRKELDDFDFDILPSDDHRRKVYELYRAFKNTTHRISVLEKHQETINKKFRQRQKKNNNYNFQKYEDWIRKKNNDIWYKEGENKKWVDAIKKIAKKEP